MVATENRLFLLISVQNELPTIRQMNNSVLLPNSIEYLALQLNLCQSTALDLRKIKQRHYTILGIHTVFLVQFEINLQK